MSWEELPLSRIYYDATRGVPGTIWPIGTPGVPSNTIANVITMLSARNLKAVDIHGAVTIVADVTHKDFFGNYHESVADIVTLGAGNDVDDSHFKGLIITGAQGGTGLATYKECMLLNMSGFRGLAENCAIFGTLAVAVGAGGFADFDRCTSVHGTITVTIGAPNRVSFKEFSGGMILKAQTDGVVLVRGISGYLEVDAMNGAGAILDIYAHGADIQINANCAAGTINIYGNARVIDLGAGATINNYTLDTKLVGWEIKDTHAHADNIIWQEVLVITATTRKKIKNIWLDFVNLTQNMEYRLSYKIDEATYRIFDSNAASPWTPALDDGVLIYCDFIISSDLKLELKSAVLETAIRNIPYEVDGEDME